MRKIYNEMVNAEWDFETDMNNITSAHVSMQRQYTKFISDIIWESYVVDNATIAPYAARCKPVDAVCVC